MIRLGMGELPISHIYSSLELGEDKNCDCYVCFLLIQTTF